MAFVLAPENPIANWLAELDLARISHTADRLLQSVGDFRSL
jgi:hypothetical protein